jgi:hypothetical protein
MEMYDMDMDMVDVVNQWIGLRENLQESTIFNGKLYGFLEIFP